MLKGDQICRDRELFYHEGFNTRAKWYGYTHALLSIITYMGVSVSIRIYPGSWHLAMVLLISPGLAAVLQALPETCILTVQ